MTWLSPSVGEWMDRLRQYHNVGDTAALPGAKVVAMVCAHMRGVFMEHHKALTNSNNHVGFPTFTSQLRVLGALANANGAAGSRLCPRRTTPMHNDLGSDPRYNSFLTFRWISRTRF